MVDNHRKVAWVTGASSGIGKAIYEKLIKKGWRVYGTSRKIPVDMIIDDAGGKMIYLDVTDEASVQKAMYIIKKNEGRLDALINNAGNGIAGAIEDTSHIEAYYQFNTNFFGALHTIRASVGMLRQSQGIIVNISSVAGVLTVPFQGLYSASKAAMEAMSEALKMELANDNIRVCLVEPGDTRTAFTQNRTLVKKAAGSHTQDILQASVAKMAKDEQNGTSPHTVADVVYRMMCKKNPPMRKAVGVSYKLLVFLNRLLPNRLILWVIKQMYA